MKLNETAYCPDCEEVFAFNLVGCPACANRYIAMLNLFFSCRQGQKWEAYENNTHKTV